MLAPRSRGETPHEPADGDVDATWRRRLRLRVPGASRSVVGWPNKIQIAKNSAAAGHPGLGFLHGNLTEIAFPLNGGLFYTSMMGPFESSSRRWERRWLGRGPRFTCTRTSLLPPNIRLRNPEMMLMISAAKKAGQNPPI